MKYFLVAVCIVILLALTSTIVNARTLGEYRTTIQAKKGIDRHAKHRATNAYLYFRGGLRDHLETAEECRTLTNKEKGSILQHIHDLGSITFLETASSEMEYPLDTDILHIVREKVDVLCESIS